MFLRSRSRAAPRSHLFLLAVTPLLSSNLALAHGEQLLPTFIISEALLGLLIGVVGVLPLPESSGARLGLALLLFASGFIPTVALLLYGPHPALFFSPLLAPPILAVVVRIRRALLLRRAVRQGRA